MDLDIFNYVLKAKVSPISSPLDRGKLLIPRVVSWKLYRPPKKGVDSGRGILTHILFMSQFNYSLSHGIWMYHGPTNDKKIINSKNDDFIYNGKASTFENLSEKDNNFLSIHIWNLQVLATEMFKISRSTSSSITKNVIKPKAKHFFNLRYIPQFSIL